MSYDRRCYDLALEFLADEVLAPRVLKGCADRLAQVIQDAAEGFIEDLRIELDAMGCMPNGEQA